MIPSNTLGELLTGLMANGDEQKAKRIVEKIMKQTAFSQQTAYLKDALTLIRDQESADADQRDTTQNLLDLLDARQQELAVLDQHIKTNIPEGSNKPEDLRAIQERAAYVAQFQQFYNYIATASYDLTDAEKQAKWFKLIDDSSKVRTRPEGLTGSVLDKKVAQVPLSGAVSDKMQLSDYLSRDLNDYLYVREKGIGANNPGKLGGQYICFYQDKDGGFYIQRSLVKQDVNTHALAQKVLRTPIAPTIHHAKNIAEVVSSRLMQTRIGNSMASVRFIRAPGEGNQAIHRPDPTGENVYMISYFYGNSGEPGDNGEELFKSLYRKAGRIPPEDRKRGMHIPFVNTEFTKVFDENIGNAKVAPTECAYQDYGRVTVAAGWTQAFDRTTSNLYVINNTLYCIDTGDAFDHLTDDVHMHSHLRHLPGLGPTNHFREYPRAFRICESFAKELEDQGSMSTRDLAKHVSDVLDDVRKEYGQAPFAEFAQHAGMQVTPGLSYDELVADTKDFLTEKLHARDISMRIFALDIRTSILLDRCDVHKNAPNVFKNVSNLTAEQRTQREAAQTELNKLIADNPSYFLHEKFHVRYSRHVNAKARRLHYRFALESSLKEYAAGKVLDNIPEMFRKDFQITDITLRAQVTMARLKILLDLTPDQTGRSQLEERITELNASIQKHLQQNNESSLEHLINDSDKAYCQMRTAYQSLQNNPAINTKLQAAMKEGATMDVATKAEQEDYLIAYQEARPSIKREGDVASPRTTLKEVGECAKKLADEFDKTGKVIAEIIILLKTLTPAVSVSRMGMFSPHGSPSTVPDAPPVVQTPSTQPHP